MLIDKHCFICGADTAKGVVAIKLSMDYKPYEELNERVVFCTDCSQRTFEKLFSGEK